MNDLFDYNDSNDLITSIYMKKNFIKKSIDLHLSFLDRTQELYFLSKTFE